MSSRETSTAPESLQWFSAIRSLFQASEVVNPGIWANAACGASATSTQSQTPSLMKSVIRGRNRRQSGAAADMEHR